MTQLLMIVIGGLALLAAIVTSLWRTRGGSDVSVIVLPFAVLAVALASGIHAPTGANAVETWQMLGRSELYWDIAAQAAMLVCVGVALHICVRAQRASRWQPGAEPANLHAAEILQPLRFFIVAAQLGALVLVMRLYSIENKTFSDQIMALVLFGFLLHELMPLEWRPSFFLLLSFTAIYIVFGWAGSFWLIGLGIALLSIFHLPLQFKTRAVIAVLAAIALAGARFYWANADLLTAVWPILASMFMFRVISYAHYLRHHPTEKDLPFVLSYFFLLPNVVFPLFPIVDYAAFRRTYYGGDKYSGYQTGIAWITRGLTHLLLYRLVYHYLIIGPGDVTSFWSFFQYVVANFLLILRLSGQFHVVVGILHLFGFNLPEVMHRYWLAFSFSEFWRRANIYWRDFMQKTVFFPVYFRLRSYGSARRVLVATVVVFVATALLHTYQWFWLRGSVVSSWPEVLFWLSFGVLVAINTFSEEKQSAAKTVRKPNTTWPAMLAVGMRAAGTFLTIAILWSLWISNSLSEWLHLWATAGSGFTKIDNRALVCVGVVVAIIIFAVADHRSRRRIKTEGAHPFVRSATATASLLAALYIVGSPGIHDRWNPRLADVFYRVRTDELNEQDMGLLQRGYYENLTRINRLNPRLADLYMKRRTQGPILEEIGGEKLRRKTGPFLRSELMPLASVTFKGAPFHVNRWGLRGKDFEERKSARTIRSALFGGSPVMGSGVGDNETFAAVLEDRLNSEATRGRHYEILNFGVGGYDMLQRLYVLEEKAFRFEPDVVIWTAHPQDPQVTLKKLSEWFQNDVPVPFQELVEIERRAGLMTAVSSTVGADDDGFYEIKGALLPFADDIVSWTYRRVVRDCRNRNVLPVYMFLPSARAFDHSVVAKDVQVAREAGFEVVDLSDVFQDQDLQALQIAPWDFHFNKDGHRLVAERLYREFHQRPTVRKRFRW